MSKIPNQEIAQWACSAITYCRGVMDGQNRSPEKIDNLIHRHLMRDDTRFRKLEDAINQLKNTDSQITGILEAIRAHHTAAYKTDEKTGKPIPVVAWVQASDTWSDTLKLLRQFAGQRGGQKLIPREECARVGKGLAKMIREFTEEALS